MDRTALLFPVLGRPHLIAPLLANIAETTPEPYQVWFAVSDRSTLLELRCYRTPRVDTDYGDTYPNRINRLFGFCGCPRLFLGADDVYFHPGWLSALHQCMDKTGAGVVVPQDGLNPAGTLALVDRRYIEEEGGPADAKGLVFHPGYHHNFCDTELFAVAAARGRLARCPEALVEHRHWVNGKAPHDGTYALGASFAEQDRATFDARRTLWMGQ